MREVLYLTVLVCISAVYYGEDYAYDDDDDDPGAADILGPYPQDYYEDIDEDPSELMMMMEMDRGGEEVKNMFYVNS